MHIGSLGKTIRAGTTAACLWQSFDKIEFKCWVFFLPSGLLNSLFVTPILRTAQILNNLRVQEHEIFAKNGKQKMRFEI